MCYYRRHANPSSSSALIKSNAFVPPGPESSSGFGLDPSATTPAPQLQTSRYMLRGPATFVPGGGAEARPAGFESSDSRAPVLIANTGYKSKDIFDFHGSGYVPQPPRPAASSSVLPSFSSLSSAVTENDAQHSSWTSALSPPFPLCLPAYSSSGFDILSILVRVANRPNKTINLGPIDMSCSFVVANALELDHPIIYASPPFYRLTGYKEHEVLGHNCRFLQERGGRVTAEDQRHHSTLEAIAFMRTSLAAKIECQTSILNYRKNGSTFLNLVTIIPVASDITNTPGKRFVEYYVGFQVELKLPHPLRDRLNNHYFLNAVSEELRGLLKDPLFVASISGPTSSAENQEGNHPLSLILLNAMPDFLLVLSLKGSFLYVAPAITHVLEYSPEEMAGKSICDYCHPSDIVTLRHELKESTYFPGPQEGQHFMSSSFSNIPKKVNLLFRARTKRGAYVWIECTGRLHMEPGKGQKAIILSARLRTMPCFSWKPMPNTVCQDHGGGRRDGRADATREVWGMLSLSGTVLFMSTNVKNVLGWGVGEIIGMSLNDIVPETFITALGTALQRAAQGKQGHPEIVECRVRQKSGDLTTPLYLTFYPLPTGADTQPQLRRLPIVCQIRPINSISTIERQLVTSISRGNVFSEEDAPEEDAWQFLLEWLKKENQKLAVEVEVLERTVRLQNQHQAT